MTIHRAIAGKPDISQKTRARILAEIERLGWRPNMAARGLRQGKTFTLGILVSNTVASFLPEILQGVNQEADAHRQRSWHRNLRRMQQRDDVPAVVLGGPRRERRIQIVGDGEQSADDVVGLKVIGFDQCTQQLIGSRQDLGRIVAIDGGGAADSLQPHWGGHGT